MAFPLGVLTILIGLLYGALKKGRQDKGRLFREGLVIGLIIAVILVILGAFFGVGGLIIGAVGALGIILSAIVYSLLFILGVWIGDLITGARRSA